MDRSKAKKIADRAVALLAGLEDEFGVKITSKGGTFGNTFYTMKLEVAEVNGGVVESKDAVNFTRYCKQFGMVPEMLGGIFRTSKTTYTVRGLAPQAVKYPVLASNGNGRMFKFSADVVKSCWIGSLPEGATPVNRSRWNDLVVELEGQ